MNDLISIIVPVYKVEDYLEKCVNSLINQTYKNLEIILVDDGSTDNSGKLCDEFAAKDKRIVVIHKTNGGLSSARNAGLKAAKGSYVGFVDSDDWVSLDMYEYMYELIIKTKANVADIECQYVYEHQADYTCNDEKTESDAKVEFYEGKDVLWHYLYRGLNKQKSAPFTVWRKLYDITLWDNIRFPEGINNEDIITNYLILGKTQKIAVSNKIKYFYYQNPNSITTGKLKKEDLSLIKVCESVNDLAKNEDYKGINELAKSKLARSYFSLIAKDAISGCSETDEEEKEIICYLTTNLRKNYLLLMNSPIQINRKILITAACIHINCLRFPFKCYSFITKVRKRIF